MSVDPIILRGITWDHSRAFPPLVATAQRYEETHPGVRIHWDKRTLDEFGHKPIEQLIDDYDLIVIDHPWAGHAFNQSLVHDLNPLVDQAVRDDLKTESIGASYESYVYEGKLMALPIDVATPAPSYRPDLLDIVGVSLPRTWSELMALARRGLTAMPGFPADLFLNWLMLCAALGGNPGLHTDIFVRREAGWRALEMIRELASYMTPEVFEWNPIQLAEAMTTRDDLAYCPFAYTYSNYARTDFTAKPLRYGNPISLDDGTPLRSVLGGTGLAISRNCRDIRAAVDYASFVSDAATQRTIYLYAGGQPAHRAAWLDAAADRFGAGFFSGSFDAHQDAIVRPRYAGYVPFQEKAGLPIQNYARGDCEAGEALDIIGHLYRASREMKPCA